MISSRTVDKVLELTLTLTPLTVTTSVPISTLRLIPVSARVVLHDRGRRASRR